MTREYDVVVVGGGLVGATTALALVADGFSVAVVEPGGGGGDPRWSAVSDAAFRAWEALGVKGLRAAAQPITAMAVSDAPGPGPATAPWVLSAALQFDPQNADGAPLGWMTPNAATLAALRRAFERGSAGSWRAARAEAVQLGDSRAIVDLSDGSRVTADLIVGADGRRSRVAAAAGIGAETIAYRQHGVVATVLLSSSHGGVARQLFLPDGPLAVLPLPHAQASLVWTTDGRSAAALTALPAAAFEALLRRRMGAEGAGVRLIGPRASFPLELRFSEALSGPRSALVGDAAQAIHPVAGQGLNLGLKDAFALSEVLAEARRLGEDIGADAVLDRYARWRRFDRVSVAAGADVFARGFSTRHPVARGLRGLASAATAASPTLRRLFLREAGAQSGDPPRRLAPQR